MTDSQIVPITRSDLDIRADILSLMRGYPPLAHDRHQVKVMVENGDVTLTGYVKSLPTYRYLLDNVVRVAGVQSVNNDEFYNDETIRLQITRNIPCCVQVHSEYGVCVLTGELPEGITVEELVERAADTRGVQRVVTSFK